MGRYDGLNQEINEARHVAGFIVGLGILSMHMTITFYATLLGFAITRAPLSDSPPLMYFIVVWHAAAIPLYLLKTFTLKISESNFGKLILLMLLPSVAYLCRDYLWHGFHNLNHWLQQLIS